MSKALFYFLLALLFALIVAVFAIQNPEPIKINFLAWQFREIPKVLVILSSTAIGALVIILLGFWWYLGKFMYIRLMEREVKELKNRLAEVPNKEKREDETGSVTSYKKNTGV